VLELGQEQERDMEELNNGNYSGIMRGEFVARKIKGSGRGRLKPARG
jgi:hypothetical protein